MKSIRQHKKLLFIFIILLSISSLQSKAQTWHVNFGDSLWNSLGGCPGGNCPVVEDIAIADSSLYLVGPFVFAGQDTMNCAARWKDNQWYDLDIYNLRDGNYSVEKYKGKLFIGGDVSWNVNDIPNTQYLCYYDNTGWNGIDGGQCWGKPIDFLKHNDTLFLAGEFGQISETLLGEIAAYYNGEWIDIGDMQCNRLYTLEVFNDTLYTGGNIGLRKRTGDTTWTNIIPSGNYIRDMVVDSANNFLYIGGTFYGVDSTASKNVIMWDGFQWHSLGTDINGTISEHAMAVYRGDLYAGGWLWDINGQTMNRIARWDGQDWHPLGWGCNNTVRAMAVFQDTLIVGGYFHKVYQSPEDSLRAYALAKWHMPDTGCNHLRPLIHTYRHYSHSVDTFYLEDGQAEVNFYNNNPYADSWQWDFGDAGTADIREPQHVYTQTGDYQVSVTVSQGACVKTVEKMLYIRYPVKIDPHYKPNMLLYPNPSSGNFTLVLEAFEQLAAKGNISLIVSNMQGKPIHNQAIFNSKTLINSNSWPKGSYVCNIYIKGQKLLSKVIVLE
jgi:hypothetical protein